MTVIGFAQFAQIILAFGIGILATGMIIYDAFDKKYRKKKNEKN